jgi:FtsH-binding integral membrane protein
MGSQTQFLRNSFMFITSGIVLGVGLDYSIYHLQTKYKLSPLETIVIQLLSSIALVFIINFYISSNFIELLLSESSGIFFVALFFNSQFNFINNMRSILHYVK